MTQVWRVNLNTSVDGSREYCLKKDTLGLGWRGVLDNNISSCDEYIKHVKNKDNMSTYKNKDTYKWSYNGLNYAINSISKIEKGDIVWAKDEKGIYYKGEILDDSPQYNKDGDHKNFCIGLYRQCKWISMPDESTNIETWKINFRTRTLQKILNKNIIKNTLALS